MMRVINVFLTLFILGCEKNPSIEEAYHNWAKLYDGTIREYRAMPNLAGSYINRKEFKVLISHPDANEYIRYRITEYIVDLEHRRKHPYDWFLLYGFAELNGIDKKLIGRPGDLDSARNILEI